MLQTLNLVPYLRVVCGSLFQDQAKKMPAAYRSFHVEQSLLGRKTKAKGAILREELEMEVLGL